MSKVDLEPGQKVTVTVTRKKRSTSGSRVVPRKAPLKVPKQRDDLGRRRVVLGRVNIYDVGQKWDGSFWRDLDFVDVPVITTSGGSPSNLPGSQTFSLSRWQALEDKIFEVELEDFHSTYRKLDYELGENYYVDLDIGGEVYSVGRENSRRRLFGDAGVIDASNWSDKGLKISSSSDFYLHETQLFAGIPETNKKITAERDYSADEVEDFVLRQNADIFLVPQPVWVYGSDGAGSPSFHTGYLNMFWSIASRELLLQNADALADIIAADPGLGEPFASVFGVLDGGFPGTASLADARDKFVSYPDARYFRIAAGYVSPATFPVGAVYEVMYYTSGINNYPAPIVRLDAGALCAVIFQGGQWYYVWNTSTIFTFKGTRLIS